MIEGILWILFILVCVAISGLVLLQEGKGGGLGDAFGGAGAQTFGVKAQGVAKVTGYMVASLMLIAILITKMRSGDTLQDKLGGDEPVGEQPAETGTGAGGDAGGGGGDDAGAGGGDDDGG